MLAGFDSPLASLHTLLALACLRVAELPKTFVAFICAYHTFPESIIVQETGKKAENQSEQGDKAIVDYNACSAS